MVGSVLAMQTVYRDKEYMNNIEIIYTVLTHIGIQLTHQK
jgi:hypothetical protein